MATRLPRAFKLSVLVLAPFLILGQAQANGQDYDRTDYEGCRHCHDFTTGEPRHPADDMQHFVAATWLLSSHANSWTEATGNTYCMKCHAPFQADPDATHSDNTPVSIEDSQAVTCSVCHPDHNLGWDPRLGIYQVGMDPSVLDPPAWIPVTEPKELCTSCHSGSRHERNLTWMKNLDCVDCHMPDYDVEALDADGNPVLDDQGDPIVRPTMSHDVDFHLDDPDALAGKVEHSCVACHAPMGFGPTTVDDAIEVILSGMIHDDKPDVDPGGPYTGVAGQPVHFDASGTSDEENNPLTYEWDFGDGGSYSGAGPTATHVYATAGSYEGSLTVSDGTNTPVTVDVPVEIVPDSWIVRMPLAGTELTVTFEEFGGFLLAQSTYPDGSSSMGLGMAWDGVIFWMDASGAIYFGTMNRAEGTMQGLIFGGAGGSSIFLGESTYP